jgi:predicted metal-dependent hydrolase
LGKAFDIHRDNAGRALLPPQREDRRMSQQPPRLVPDVPLPPYRFVPGRSPHPISDPKGHSYGIKPTPSEPLDPGRWNESWPYILGIDLFNHAYYWEAHEQWESLWHACGRTGATADFLKGLIKLAAAGVKNLEGKAEGVKSHARRAAELWNPAAEALGVGQGLFLGLCASDVIQLAARISRDGWPSGPVLLLPTLPK